jgi:hypothetical protein
MQQRDLFGTDGDARLRKTADRVAVAESAGTIEAWTIDNGLGMGED